MTESTPVLWGTAQRVRRDEIALTKRANAPQGFPVSLGYGVWPYSLNWSMSALFVDVVEVMKS